MQVSWVNDLSKLIEQTKIAARISCIAYVDDITWIVSSRAEMQIILDIAHTFYTINDSQVNPNKSHLLVINCPKEDRDKPVYVETAKVPVTPVEARETIRFLNVYLSAKNQTMNVM